MAPNAWARTSGGLNNQSLAATTLSGTGNLFRGAGLNPRGNNELNTALQRLGVGSYMGAANRGSFNLGLEDDYQGVVRDLLNRIQSRNYAQEGERAAGGIRAQYANAAMQGANQARAQGLGEGVLGGYLGANSLSAAREAGSAVNYYNDPARRDEDMAQLVSLLQNVISQNPYLQELLAMNAQTESNSQFRQQSRGPGIGALLGQVAGGLASNPGVFR